MSASVQHDLVQGVVAHVVQHVLQSRAGPIACWTYVTEGLRAYGQQEIVFSLVRPTEASVDQARHEPLQFLAAVARFAQQERVVRAGGVTEIGPRGLFGVPALRGVVYERAWPMSDVPLPADALAAIALVDPEMEIAKRYGVLRVLARIGRAYAFFPTAPWCDPGRAPLMPAETKTILEGVAGVPASGVSVTIEGARVSVRLPRATQQRMREIVSTLPSGAAFAVHARLAPNADGCLVWSPGQNGPEAISMPGGRGACISANFILFVAEQPADAVSVFEDGVVAMLSNASWSRVREALASGTTIAITPQTQQSKAMSIDWY